MAFRRVQNSAAFKKAMRKARIRALRVIPPFLTYPIHTIPAAIRAPYLIS